MDQGLGSTLSHRIAPQLYYWAIVSALIGLSSVVPHAMGAAFALTCAAGLGGLCTKRPSPAIPSWLQYWLIACTAAMVLRGIGVLYWAESWRARHGELKLLLGALCAIGLWRLVRHRMTVIALVSHGLTIALVCGLLWTWQMGRDKLVTHAIAWANVMALMTCWLLAVALDARHRPSHRLVWLTGSVAGLLAVLISQSRGAYTVVAWCMAVLGWHSWRVLRSPQAPARDKQQVRHALVLLLAALVVVLSTPGIRQTLQTRVIGHIQTAANEAGQSGISPSAGANTSVGARLYMWQRSLPAIAQSLWVGYGDKTKQELIRSWGQEAASDEVRSLRHLHNEYLDTLMEHGLWGLASQLTYIAMLLALALHLQRRHQRTASLAVAGMTVVLAAAGLSNVNFGHNFFTAGLAMLLTLALALLPTSGQDSHT